MSARYAQGQRILEGTVLRRIPNWRTHFDEDAGRPAVAAFIPRPQDNAGLSAHIEALVSVETVLRFLDENFRSYGLCRLDIATIEAETGGTVCVRYDRTNRPLGHAHVVIRPCVTLEVQLALARMAVVVRSPSDLMDAAPRRG